MSNKTIKINRSLLRLSAMLLLAGILLSLLAGIAHPGTAPANDHHASFTEYAHSDNWTLVHLGQFAGMAVLIIGLLTLGLAIDAYSGTAGKFGAVSGIVALGLYAVLQALDGVALKQVVDAWVSAPEAEKAGRLASAEAIRWLEWAFRSYQSFILGVTFLLYAIVILRTARVARMLGCLMGISGIAYIAQGWVTGFEGFSETNALPILLGILSILAWSVWLFIAGWRMQDSVEVPGARREFARN